MDNSSGTLRYLRWRKYKMLRRMKRRVVGKVFQDRNPALDNNLLVAGIGRSGTTWLADVLATHLRGRLMFEPFYNKPVEQLRPLHYFQYMRPDEHNPLLLQFCRELFSGEIRHPWIDGQVETIWPTVRIIKAIRANLMLKWLTTNFPTLPIILLMRHPCAVVLSRMKLGWQPEMDIEPLLAQPKLIEDFLQDKISLIRDARTVEERHAVNWCVNHIIPLAQFRPQELNVIYYEHLCIDPENVFRQVFQTLSLPFTPSIVDESYRPSTTSLSKSAVIAGEDKTRGWQKELSNTQVKNILNIVEQFGLGDIYNETPLPLENYATTTPTIK